MLRRRLHNGKANSRTYENYRTSDLGDLDEPLLSRDEFDDKKSEVCKVEDKCDEERRKEQLHWTFLYSSLIVQWVQWLANIVFGSGSLLIRLSPQLPTIKNGPIRKLLLPGISPLQGERLRNLQQRLKVPFDGSLVEHQDALKALWRLAYPNRQLPPLKSELWKDMGWQGSDPSTDFRGGGFISLENLIFFAQEYPESFQRLLHKQDGERAEWEYPFAVAGINISFMLAQMLDLQSEKPSSTVGIRFLELLSEDPLAFDHLYCVAFQMMDSQWLEKRSSYMEFNDVLKSTRTQLERGLALEDVSSVKDLPAYNMLRR